MRAFLGAVGTEEERQLAREHVAVAEIAAAAASVELRWLLCGCASVG